MSVFMTREPSPCQCRSLSITRDKARLVGTLISYDCFLNVDYKVFRQLLELVEDGEQPEDEDESVASLLAGLKSIPIRNGETISIEIGEEQQELFVVAYTSSGPSISNLQIIEAGTSDVSFFIKQEYSWKEGVKLTII